MDSSEIAVERSSFPNNFVFGAATSTYQVEGALNADGEDSNADGRNGRISLDRYNMFKEDVALTKKVGLNSYRFSISWSRILPRGKLIDGKGKSTEGIKYYSDLIDALLAQGIEPWVTLFHWDVPQSLEDEYRGFLDRQIVKHFCEFAKICFEEFGNRVKYWITLNEPWAFTYYKYVRGNFPPGAISILHRICAMSIPHVTSSEGDPVREVDSSVGEPVRELVATAQNLAHNTSSNGKPGTDPYTVAHNLILAHARAVEIYRKYYQDRRQGKIGMTNVSPWFYPLEDNNQDDEEAASRALDFMLGWFLAPVTTGEYPPSMRNNIRGDRLPEFTEDEIKLVKGSYDFLGINYYTTYYVKNIRGNISQHHYDNDLHVEYHTHRNGKPIGQPAGWPWLYVYPEGIYHLMLYIRKKYRNPNIIITENGLDDVNSKALTISKARIDETRIKYHKDHLAYLKKAIDQDVRVKGYFIWSLIDNFEWAQEYNVRFGIFYVDFQNGRLTKFPKRSAMWWMNFLKQPKKVTGCQN
ncbi:beta-glucosidase-like [Olea europaea var. sylvestris]|uniref:beta-glucosidase-like n=1 Tax=Olea europaea var. sylvestris TaxID=158386 RepID=UPI000C1D1E47|nr:beta-glucosidase-like [Olea europaea var. sylvestris]